MNASAEHEQAWLVSDAAERMAVSRKPHGVPQVGSPPYSPKDRFKLALYSARESYFVSINQKNPYLAGYHMAMARVMQDRAIGIAMEQGALFSEILPTVELFKGQFDES